METEPELEFEFMLAQKLGRTVAEMRRMDMAEFVGWRIFYSRKWQREELEAKKAGM